MGVVVYCSKAMARAASKPFPPRKVASPSTVNSVRAPPLISIAMGESICSSLKKAEKQNYSTTKMDRPACAFTFVALARMGKLLALCSGPLATLPLARSRAVPGPG